MSARLPVLAMLIGALVALLEVAFGGLLRAPSPTPEQLDAAAVVDGVAILQSDVDRAGAALAADMRRPLDAQDRAHVRDRLIDELLLVEHGLALELPQRDPFLRTQIARAVIDRVQAEVEMAEPPTEAQLREHHAAHPERFAASTRLELRSLWIAGTNIERAQQLATRWAAGESYEQLRADADPPPIELPEHGLSATKLRDYLGPTIVERLLALELGRISEALPAAGGAWVFELRGRTPGAPLPFEQLREQVERDIMRERGEQALAQLLEQLRADADIVLAEERP